MSHGKRPINISLGGASGIGSKPNPFAARPTSSKSALGFQGDDDEDDDDQSSATSGAPKRKLIKLDHTEDEAPPSVTDGGDDDRDYDDFSATMETKGAPPPPPRLRKPARESDDDDDDDGFSKLTASKAAPNPPPPLRKPIRWDEDDEGDVFSQRNSKKAGDAETKQEQVGGEDEEEDDPLDAFMAGIDTQVQEEAEKPSTEKVRRDDIEDEDDLESYMKHMKKKGIKIGQGGPGGPVTVRNEDVDSDEEVYATARAIDNAADVQYDAEEMHDPTAKKEITPLPRMDHSRQNYIEIEKCFYEEHEDIAKLDGDQVKQIRTDLDMRVLGIDIAKPCISFAHFGFEEPIMETIRRLGYSEPSGIQRQAIPVALSGRDIIGIAKTGSGKTAAFLLPMIVHIMDQPELEKGDGPIGVVLAPTRELADQIYGEAKRFAKAYGLRVAVVYGGASKRDQFQTLRSGVEIVVATPGRLIDMIKIKATNFRRTSFLVLDEADRVFDLGFGKSLTDRLSSPKYGRFAITFARIVRMPFRNDSCTMLIFHAYLSPTTQINSDVTQVIQVLKDDTLKWPWLLDRLQEFESLGSVLIFVSRKDGVIELTENLKKARVKCECLHGDMVQQERDKAVHDYKAKLFPTLIATDVAARGLDIKSVRTVVNYDVARDIDSHVHRVGRTGRAGEKGTAYTLLTEKDDRFAGDLVRNLEEFGEAVSPEVIKIAMQNPRFRKMRQHAGSSRGGRGGRGGGGRGGRGRGRGGHGGRGGGSGGHFQSSEHSQQRNYSSSSNNVPLGQGDRHSQSHHGARAGAGDVRGHDSGSGDSSRQSGSAYRVSGFQKASRPETGAQESPFPTATDQSPGHQQSVPVPTTHNHPAQRPPQPPPGQLHQRPPPPPFPEYGYSAQRPAPPPPGLAHPNHPPPRPMGMGPPPPGFPLHGRPPFPPPPGFPFPPPRPGMFNPNQPRPPFPPQPMPPHLSGRPPAAGFSPQQQQQQQQQHQGHASQTGDRRRRWES
ncbi:ATP-dependent RNA helicase ddx42 [Dissophora globulifera]|uniref:RNA helicase n=1 Tax=Dissophora globulifera TaxID=979702 RepID=A0A9P6RE25_9FUNG|nr:ATP-dependent RNA helicase ddx42 [Dissophora globulifera]